MSIKLYIGHEIRRLNLSETKSYQDLIKKTESYVKPNSGHVYKYLDVDSDWVTFSTEEEWQEALKNFHKDGFKIRLFQIVPEGQNVPQEKHHGHHGNHHERQEHCERKKQCPRFQQGFPPQAFQGCPRFQGCKNQGMGQFQQQLQDLFSSPQSKQGLNDIVGQLGEFGKQLLGGQNLNDLQELFKPQQKETGEIVHGNVVCDGCNVTPIKGDRYVCNELKDFDLCAKCFDEQKFKDPTHTFTKVTHPIGSRGFWNDFMGEIQKEAEKYTKQQEKEEIKEEKAPHAEIIEIKEEVKPELVIEDIPLIREEQVKTVEYSEQLDLLRSMGFTNDEQNLVSLKKWKGQIQRVVSELLNQ